MTTPNFGSPQQPEQPPIPPGPGPELAPPQAAPHPPALHPGSLAAKRVVEPPTGSQPATDSADRGRTVRSLLAQINPHRLATTIGQTHDPADTETSHTPPAETDGPALAGPQEVPDEPPTEHEGGDRQPPEKPPVGPPPVGDGAPEPEEPGPPTQPKPTVPTEPPAPAEHPTADVSPEHTMPPTAEARQEFADTLDQLKPYANRTSIEVVGHRHNVPGTDTFITLLCTRTVETRPDTTDTQQETKMRLVTGGPNWFSGNERTGHVDQISTPLNEDLQADGHVGTETRVSEMMASADPATADWLARAYTRFISSDTSLAQIGASLDDLFEDPPFPVRRAHEYSVAIKGAELSDNLPVNARWVETTDDFSDLWPPNTPVATVQGHSPETGQFFLHQTVDGREDMKVELAPPAVDTFTPTEAKLRQVTAAVRQAIPQRPPPTPPRRWQMPRWRGPYA